MIPQRGPASVMAHVPTRKQIAVIQPESSHQANGPRLYLRYLYLNLVQRAVRHKAEAIYKCTCVCVSAARSQRCRAGLWKSLLDPHVGTQRNTSVPSPPHKVALLGTGVSGFANTTHLINTSTASSGIFSTRWLETGRVGPEPGHRGVRSVPKP